MLDFVLKSVNNPLKYFQGNITTVATIDREKTPAFHFAVQVKDGKIPERTAYSMV